MVYLVDQLLANSASYSKSAIITTTYRDDYIIRGQSFANESTRVVSAGTEYFVLDATLCDCTQVIKLPIAVAPSSGYIIVNLYEDTDYVGGTTVLTLSNRNRLSTIVAKTTLKLVDTIGTDKGTALFSTLFGTEATNQNSGGGSGSSANALLLNPSKKYLFEVIYSEACTVGYNMEIVEV